MTYNASKGTLMEMADEKGAQWVQTMQSHFGRTGTYRPVDVARVLGDPRHTVTIPAVYAVPGLNAKA